MPLHHLPIACSLDAGALHDRTARWRALADAALLDAELIPGGARQRYRPDPGVERELRELVALEADCCPFLDFVLTAERSAIALEVHAPAEAGALLELFASGPSHR